jgi:diguanylate cyclase (GGDEF)-like protein/PAS domain S-box-containing protein
MTGGAVAAVAAVAAGGLAALAAAVAVLLRHRRVRRLTELTLRLAAGDLDPGAAPEGPGDLGRLGAALNALSRAGTHRVVSLAAARNAAETRARNRAASQEQLQLVMDGSQDGFWDWDIRTGAVGFSRRWLEMLGYRMLELEQTRAAWEELIHPEDAPEVRRRLADHLEGRTSHFESEHRLRCRSGEWRWILDRGRVVWRAADGRPLRMAGTHTDVTARKEADAELRRLNGELARTVENLLARNREFQLLAELTAMLQGCHRVTQAEAVLAAVLPEFFPGLSGTLFLAAGEDGPLRPTASWGPAGRPPSLDHRHCRAIRLRRPHVVAGCGEGPCDHVAARPGWTSACVPLPSQGMPSGVLSLRVEGEVPASTLQLARAVTDAIGLSLANLRLRESLHHQSISDPLTGLHNRRFMQESLNRELLRARRSGVPVGICMVDIDHFKRINDVHGHDAGDAVLLELGRLLRESVRASDIVCRYGGEEFTIILPESRLESTVERADALLRACRALRVAHRGRLLDPVTISIGIAEYPGHAEDVEALLHSADAALYAAKQRGRDRVVVAPADPRTDLRLS